MYLEDWKLHTRIPLPPVSIGKEQMFAFARQYDPLPMHLDEEYAKGTRFGGLIVPGMMSFLEVWVQFARQDLFGEALIAGKNMSVEWYRPVYVDDVLSGTAEVTKVAKRNAHNGIVEVTVEVFNQRGEHVFTGKSDSVILCKPQ